MPERPTPALMFQGTSSNAGKSVLCAGFCRMLRQDGFSVAPFKAQNMSLNSFVTPDNREIGRAQATQAQACKLEPDARMNPVLLKPITDMGSQVLVMGRPRMTMKAAEYYAHKPALFQEVKEAYDSLAREHEVMVLEGAGSPAEINLKAHDIVNMAMAAHARAKVLLVGDIDRGGVFAALYGTMGLLDPREQDLVAGYVLNRFRGDASLLDPALEEITRLTGKPFFGVVPYIRDLGLPEEDSVSFKEGSLGRSVGAGAVRIALVDLERISNFNDADPLAAEPDVDLVVARAPADLKDADAVLLPGSRSTAADLRALWASGLAQAILDMARARPVEIVGLCGGYQMLHHEIADPHGLEGGASSIPGLGLLPMRTELGPDKVLRRTRARHVESGHWVEGYEIHHGQSRVCEDLPGARSLETFFTDEQDSALGQAMVLPSQGRAWGTYLHGVFEAQGFRRDFIDRIRRAKGLDPLNDATRAHDPDAALDRLADHLREHMDWQEIYSLLGLRS